MSNLGRRKNFNIQSETIYQALTYFEKKLSEIEFLILELTARHAFSDDHLFEMFEMWNNAELSDDGFLFQIKEYQSADVLPPLAESDRDLSGKFSEIEKLKKNIDTDFSSHFAKTLQMLAAKNGLSTNEKVGEF